MPSFEQLEAEITDYCQLRGRLGAIKKALDTAIDPKQIKKLDGMSYVEGGYVYDTLNDIFGLGWNNRIVYHEQVDLSEGSKPGMHSITYNMIVEIEIPALGIKRQGSGSCNNTAKTRGKAIDTAFKGAETDALKRAARTIGKVLGLQLYPGVKKPANEAVDVGATKAKSRELFKEIQAEIQALGNLQDPSQAILELDKLLGGKWYKAAYDGINNQFRPHVDELITTTRNNINYMLEQNEEDDEL